MKRRDFMAGVGASILLAVSRGNTQDLETLYETWRGAKPSIDGLLRQRGLTQTHP